MSIISQKNWKKNGKWENSNWIRYCQTYNWQMKTITSENDEQSFQKLSKECEQTSEKMK